MFRRAKKAKEAPAVEGRSTVLAFVLFEDVPALTAEALTSAWKSAWPTRPAPQVSEEGEDEGVLTVDLGPLAGAVAVMPATIPNNELEGPAATSWLWPDASADVQRVGAHAVVWLAGDASAVEAHLEHTRLVTAVIGATGGLGVYCGESGQVVKGGVFEALAKEYTDNAIPVMLWVAFRGYVDQAGRSSLFTVGMDRFGLMELEISGSARQVGDLREFAMNTAEYLMKAGPVINDGDTVGGSEHERIVVRHAKSALDRPGLVYRIEGF